MTIRTRCFVFAGTHASFILAMYLLNPLYVRLPSEFSVKNHQLMQLSSVDVFVLGSSHTYFGVSAADISEKSYNAALSSQSYKYDFLVLKSLIDRKVQINSVVLPISSFSRSYEVETGIESWRKYQYWHTYKLHIYSLQDYFDIRSHIAIMGDVDAYGSLRKIVTGNSTTPLNNLSNDGTGSNADVGIASAIVHKQAVEAARRHLSISGSAGEYWFRKIIELCKSTKIKLILISTPVTDEYYQLVSTVLKRDQDTLSGIAKSIEREVVFCDYSRSTNFTYRDFYDCDHLNPTGAKKLGRLLRQYSSTKPN